MSQLIKPDGYYWNQLSESSKKMFNADRIARNRNPETCPQSQVDIAVNLSKRNFLKLGAAAGVGALIVPLAGCGKNISFYTSTVIGALKDLSPLLPNLSDRIKQAIAVAESFDKAYQSGAFANAASLFETLTTVVSEIVAAIGVMSDSVKLAIAVGGVALRAIGVLLKSQASDPVVAAEVARSSNQSAKAMIEKMGDITVIDKMLQLVMP